MESVTTATSIVGFAAVVFFLRAIMLKLLEQKKHAAAVYQIKMIFRGSINVRDAKRLSDTVLYL